MPHQPRGPRPTRIVIATPPKPVGRPKVKVCAAPECKNQARGDNRYCSFCAGKQIAGLHASPEWLTWDIRYRHGEGGMTVPYAN